MAKRKSLPQTNPTPVLAPINLTGIQWDESRDRVDPWILSVRDTNAFLNVAISSHIEARWGTFSHIKTATDKTTGRVTIGKGDPDKDSDLVKVNRSKSQNSIYFSFYIPLQKLRVRPAPDRQWDMIVQEQPVQNGLPVYIVDIAKRTSLPRNLKEEAEATGEAPQGHGGTAAPSAGEMKVAKAMAKSLGDAATGSAVDAEMDDMHDELDEMENRLTELDRAFDAFQARMKAEGESGSGT